MDSKQIKKLRKELKLTQHQMAEKLGIGNKTYWLIESGLRSPSRPVKKLLDIEQNIATTGSHEDVSCP